MREVDVPCRTKRGRPKRKFMDEMKDMFVMSVTEEATEHRVRWSRLSLASQYKPV